MAITVVTHSDGKSTSSYPIEWFKEFIEVYPNEALKFLVSETFKSEEANWYQEDEFYHVLEEKASIFDPTQWFLLCRSLPLASSEKIIANGLAVLSQIDDRLQDVYSRWIQSLPYVVHTEGESQYSEEITTQFEQQFGITLKSESETSSANEVSYAKPSSPSSRFQATSKEKIMTFLETNSLTEAHAPQLLQLLNSITDFEDKKEIIRQVAKSFRYRDDVGKWADNIFEPESQEWLYFNVSLFVFVKDGWFHGLYYSSYLKRTYEINPMETISTLKEILAYSISEGRYGNLLSCNLIKALSELKVEETLVQNLLRTTFHIVKRRLPNPPKSEINTSIYKGLEKLNRDEMVVVLLIARLKTLTTEKTQGIIWSLIFIAQTEPTILIKPYIWAFSNPTNLLPIHRAILLQILKEYVDQSLITEELIGQMLMAYPTGFFLEDQYIRSFVDYKIELNEQSSKSILLTPNEIDKGFFPFIHLKYRTLLENSVSLKGTYAAYVYKRDKIGRKHDGYYIRTDEVMTPIVPLANASYEIVNSQCYSALKKLTNLYHPSYICNLRFYLVEIITQMGALTRRPSCLPNIENFPSFEICNTSSPMVQESWVLLASNEKELFGERYKPKKNRNSSLVITFGDEPVIGGEFYARYIFNADQYTTDNIVNAPFDQPICQLTIIDNLERTSIIYISPFIIRELGLTVDFNLHNGFKAINDKGESVVKMLTWKENYLGSVSDGTEVPLREGVAVIIREDYFDKMLSLYQKEGWFVLSKEMMNKKK